MHGPLNVECQIHLIESIKIILFSSGYIPIAFFFVIIPGRSINIFSPTSIFRRLCNDAENFHTISV